MSESITKQKIPMSFNLDDFYTTQEQRDEIILRIIHLKY